MRYICSVGRSFQAIVISALCKYGLTCLTDQQVVDVIATVGVCCTECAAVVRISCRTLAGPAYRPKSLQFKKTWQYEKCNYQLVRMLQVARVQCGLQNLAFFLSMSCLTRSQMPAAPISLALYSVVDTTNLLKHPQS
jgi:hypothetical protein